MHTLVNRAFCTISILVGSLVILLLLATWLTPGIWVSKNEAIRVLENQGYQKVTITDKDVTFITWSGCGNDDDAVFEASAVNARNQRVNVIVCAGWPFKGATVRVK